MKSAWPVLFVVLLYLSVGDLLADPAVNRAFEESKAQITELRNQYHGEELVQKLRKLPLLNSDELKRLNAEQQLKLRDKRLEYLMGTYAELDEQKKTQAARSRNARNQNVPARRVVKKMKRQIDERDFERVLSQVKDNSESVEGVPINENFLSGMLDAKMKEQLSVMMKKNPLTNVSKEEISAQIDLNAQGTPMGKMMARNPKIKELMVEVAHDEKALPSLISIINKPDQMKYYGITVGVIFVVAFLLNLNNTKGNLLKRIFFKLCLGAGTFTANIAAFYFFFQDEVNPTFRVAAKVFGFA
ncbi:MAG: hypothetical protein CME65_00990 [Halobacteriovoraceae bacterium]|nr:hypothetical protein [Halobacteriovoraceae bacterium]